MKTIRLYSFKELPGEVKSIAKKNCYEFCKDEAMEIIPHPTIPIPDNYHELKWPDYVPYDTECYLEQWKDCEVWDIRGNFYDPHVINSI
jgi:hypothetical protein